MIYERTHFQEVIQMNVQGLGETTLSKSLNPLWVLLPYLSNRSTLKSIFSLTVLMA